LPQAVDLGHWQLASTATLSAEALAQRSVTSTGVVVPVPFAPEALFSVLYTVVRP
jgi:hypothetical protein